MRFITSTWFFFSKCCGDGAFEQSMCTIRLSKVCNIFNTYYWTNLCWFARIYLYLPSLIGLFSFHIIRSIWIISYGFNVISCYSLFFICFAYKFSRRRKIYTILNEWLSNCQHRFYFMILQIACEYNWSRRGYYFKNIKKWYTFSRYFIKHKVSG